MSEGRPKAFLAAVAGNVLAIVAGAVSLALGSFFGLLPLALGVSCLVFLICAIENSPPR